MESIKQLIGLGSSGAPGPLVKKFLKDSGYNSRGELKANYDKLLSEAVVKCENPKEFFNLVIKKNIGEKNEGKIIKLLTIVHKFTLISNYNNETMGLLEQIGLIPTFCQEKEKWFREFCDAYCGYLMKLSSISDILQRCSKFKMEIMPETHLT